MPTYPRVTDAVQRLRGVFQEIPGTQLTLADASRLSGLERTLCYHVLVALEEVGYLRRGSNGIYQRRLTDSPRS